MVRGIFGVQLSSFAPPAFGPKRPTAAPSSGRTDDKPGPGNSVGATLYDHARVRAIAEHGKA